MRISVRIDDDAISAVAFRSTTCVVALAACSRLSEMVLGCPVSEARALSPEELASDLGHIPAHRMDRCELAVCVLRSALADAGRRVMSSPNDKLEATG